MSHESKEKITLTVKQKKPRDRLFQVLNDILTFAEQKRKIPNNSDKIKQAWSRIAISAISTYGQLLKDSELEEIEERLSKLETDSELKKYR